MQDLIENYTKVVRSLGQLRRFYQHCLWTSPEAQKYLIEKRGISWDAAKFYQLGYAPFTKKTERFLKMNYMSTQPLIDGGVWALNESGEVRDMFAMRIVCPVFSVSGEVVGFSGRVIDPADETSPKYINSFSSPIFQKSLVLYGLHQAVSSIKKKGYAIGVEGNLDVVSLHQFGISNAVAPCGTALTLEQLLLLRLFTDTFVCYFDNDGAGLAARVKAEELCKEAQIRFLTINPGDAKDPDEYVRKMGTSYLNELISRVLKGG